MARISIWRIAISVVGQAACGLTSEETNGPVAHPAGCPLFGPMAHPATAGWVPALIPNTQNQHHFDGDYETVPFIR